jgi:hypothetical protein
MGSMFHGKNGVNQGGGKGNHIKTIITRSGHTVAFNDDESGTWGITIKDKNGNVVNLDTKGKNITISAPETMTLNAKNMIINVQENLTCNVGKNMEENITETQTTISKNIKIDVEDMETVVKNNKSVEVKNKLSTNAKKGEHSVKGGNYNISSDKKVIIKGGSEVKLT